MFRVVFFCLVSLSTIGCGRPATVQDCEHIVARITELELKKANVTDPEQIRLEVEESKAAFREETMARCVGRRVTEGFMECITSAQSADRLLEDCLE